MAEIEQTLIIFKPDTIQRGLVGEIITRFERAGLKIVAMKMMRPDEVKFHDHYEGIGKLISRWGEDIYNVTMKHMTRSPIIVFVLEGVEAVSYVRKLVGTTDPQDSPAGTIRGDYTHITRAYTNPSGRTMPNILHASGDADEAKQEIALWFDKDEIYPDYENVQAKIVHGVIPGDK